MEGIENVKVDLSTGEASFEETGSVDMAALRERIIKAGYQIGQEGDSH